MGRAIALRDDFDGPGLRHLAKRSKDGPQSRRLLALAEIYDRGRRTDAARIGGVGLQVIRDWVVRFNAEGPDGLIDRKPQVNARSSMTNSARHLRGWSRTAQSRLSTAWCAGGARIWRFGYSRSSAFPWKSRRWAVNCGPWGSAR